MGVNCVYLTLGCVMESRTVRTPSMSWTVVSVMWEGWDRVRVGGRGGSGWVGEWVSGVEGMEGVVSVMWEGWSRERVGGREGREGVGG